MITLACSLTVAAECRIFEPRQLGSGFRRRAAHRAVTSLMGAERRSPPTLWMRPVGQFDERLGMRLRGQVFYLRELGFRLLITPKGTQEPA
jgi:hypothetical protein